MYPFLNLRVVFMGKLRKFCWWVDSSNQVLSLPLKWGVTGIWLAGLVGMVVTDTRLQTFTVKCTGQASQCNKNIAIHTCHALQPWALRLFSTCGFCATVTSTIWHHQCRGSLCRPDASWLWWTVNKKDQHNIGRPSWRAEQAMNYWDHRITPRATSNPRQLSCVHTVLPSSTQELQRGVAEKSELCPDISD